MELKPKAFSENVWHPCPSVKVPGDVDLAKVQEVLQLLISMIFLCPSIFSPDSLIFPSFRFFVLLF